MEDDTGARLAAAGVPEGIEGVARLHSLIGDHTEEATVATEADRALFVGALVAAGDRVLGG